MKGERKVRHVKIKRLGTLIILVIDDGEVIVSLFYRRDVHKRSQKATRMRLCAFLLLPPKKTSRSCVYIKKSGEGFTICTKGDDHTIAPFFLLPWKSFMLGRKGQCFEAILHSADDHMSHDLFDFLN